ncbi:MAG TPA: porin [Burkholderiales bacterium]|nr:porin [Burkholderiales bacterium]
MNKKVLAAALAGAFGAPALALAQSSTVQVFGTLYVEYTVRADQADAAAGVSRSNADFIQTPGSEIGFKGEEKLGGGLSAWFQCASTADPRGQNQDGWCSRNSALGLKGGFGNVFIGNWDTPFKRTISPTAVGGNDTGIFGTAFLLTGNSTTTAVGGARTTFKRRQNNLITYDSPTFAGFQVMAAFTSSQTSTGTLEAATNNKARVMSIGGQYSAGPLYISAGFEQLRDFAGAGGPDSSKDNAWHVGAAYTWGPVRFGGQYTEQRFDTTAGDVKAKAWHVGVDWHIVGPHGLRAAFTQARDMSGPAGFATPVVAGVGGSFVAGPAGGSGYRPGPGNDTGANLVQVRYVYTFSKRTEFTLGYVRLDNDNNAGYRLGGLGGAIVNGQNEDAIAFAVRHRF